MIQKAKNLFGSFTFICSLLACTSDESAIKHRPKDISVRSANIDSEVQKVDNELRSYARKFSTSLDETIYILKQSSLTKLNCQVKIFGKDKFNIRENADGERLCEPLAPGDLVAQLKLSPEQIKFDVKFFEISFKRVRKELLATQRKLNQFLTKIKKVDDQSREAAHFLMNVQRDRAMQALNIHDVIKLLDTAVGKKKLQGIDEHIQKMLTSPEEQIFLADLFSRLERSSTTAFQKAAIILYIDLKARRLYRRPLRKEIIKRLRILKKHAR